MKRLLILLSIGLVAMGYGQQKMKFSQPQMPLATDKENVLTTFVLPIDKGTTLQQLTLSFKSKERLLDLAQVAVYVGTRDKKENATLFAKTQKLSHKVVLKGDYKLLAKDSLHVWITAHTIAKPELLNKVLLAGVEAKTSATNFRLRNTSKEGQRFAITLRKPKQDGVACYRIPGLVTTPKGTLIAIYDNRYNNCKDLQEDINIGMSRSTDGGHTWEPMKEIVDMGRWGNLPEELNGVGDAAVLVDEQKNTIWVICLCQHGLDTKTYSWWGSKQGLSPEETGQLLVVKSEDDGLTWSKPVNITSQVKRPEWRLFFEGPGSGIMMKDGTLVFAGQFKDENQVPHSTIIYSKDHGATWQVGTGAKTHTTEAQVVELEDGSLMLNMRDDRNRTNYELSDDYHGRSVAITTDMGATWKEHPTSRLGLVEPNCMASIIRYRGKGGKPYLLFSNPANATQRTDLSIKVSDDEGKSWDKLPQTVLYEAAGLGYSCLTVVDKKTIAILYEGADGELYFQKIPVKQLLKKRK